MVVVVDVVVEVEVVVVVVPWQAFLHASKVLYG